VTLPAALHLALLQLDVSQLEPRTEWPVPGPDSPLRWLLYALLAFWLVAWCVAGWYVGERRGKPLLGAIAGLFVCAAVSLLPFISKFAYGAVLVALIALGIRILWVPKNEEPGQGGPPADSP
jgi:hypothetical protein